MLLIAYWLFDNLDILCQLRILKTTSTGLEKKGKICWFVSVLLHIILNLKISSSSSSNLKYFARQLELVDQQGEYKEVLLNKIDLLKKRRLYSYIGIVKCLGDLMISSRDIGLFRLVFSSQIVPDMIAGVGGSVSSALSLWGMYKYTTNSPEVLFH